MPCILAQLLVYILPFTVRVLVVRFLRLLRRESLLLGACAGHARHGGCHSQHKRENRCLHVCGDLARHHGRRRTLPHWLVKGNPFYARNPPPTCTPKPLGACPSLRTTPLSWGKRIHGRVGPRTPHHMGLALHCSGSRRLLLAAGAVGAVVARRLRRPRSSWRVPQPAQTGEQLLVCTW